MIGMDLTQIIELFLKSELCKDAKAIEELGKIIFEIAPVSDFSVKSFIKNMEKTC